jgi:hypothetical protein
LFIAQLRTGEQKGRPLLAEVQSVASGQEELIRRRDRLATCFTPDSRRDGPDRIGSNARDFDKMLCTLRFMESGGTTHG